MNDIQKTKWETIQEVYAIYKIAPPTQAKYRQQRRKYLACLKKDSSRKICKDMPIGIPYYKQAGKIFYKSSEINEWIKSGKVV